MAKQRQHAADHTTQATPAPRTPRPGDRVLYTVPDVASPLKGKTVGAHVAETLDGGAVWLVPVTPPYLTRGQPSRYREAPAPYDESGKPGTWRWAR